MPNTMLISPSEGSLNLYNQPHKGGNYYCPIFQMQKLRLRELKALALSPEFKLSSVCLCSAISQALPCSPNPLSFLALSNIAFWGPLLVTSQGEAPCVTDQ